MYHINDKMELLPCVRRALSQSHQCCSPASLLKVTKRQSICAHSIMASTSYSL